MNKLCRPVLVETKEKSNLFLLDGLLYLLTKPALNYGDKTVHINIISLDNNEMIKEGDWYIDDTNRVRQSVTSDKDYWLRRPDYNKIIASTDKSLITNKGLDSFSGKPNCLPQPSPEYIQKLVEQYNRGKVKDIEVEYEEMFAVGIRSAVSIGYRLKLTNSFIIIKPVEPIVYTEEELANIAIAFGEYLDTQNRNLKSMDNWYYDWLDIKRNKQ